MWRYFGVDGRDERLRSWGLDGILAACRPQLRGILKGPLPFNWFVSDGGVEVFFPPGTPGRAREKTDCYVSRP